MRYGFFPKGLLLLYFLSIGYATRRTASKIKPLPTQGRGNNQCSALSDARCYVTFEKNWSTTLVFLSVTFPLFVHVKHCLKLA